MKNLFVGIDFSKEKFNVTAIKAVGVEECGPRAINEFKMTTAGFRSLLKWVEDFAGEYSSDTWLFCGENTGDYSRRLCEYLYGEGYAMWLENAKSIRYSAAMKRLKTDNADSAMIAEYAMRNYDKAVLYEPLSPILSELRELFLFRHKLVQEKCKFEVRDSEKKHCLPASKAKTIISRISKHEVADKEKQIKEIDQVIKNLIASDEELRRTYDIITSVPGMGYVNATSLIVYTHNFKKFGFESRKIACYYGVAPFGRDSGSSVHCEPHVHYMANKLIKSYLTQAALASVKYCAPIGRYYVGLVGRGKKKQVALNNVKNKLLHIVTAMVKNDQMFQPDYDYNRAIMMKMNLQC